MNYAIVDIETTGGHADSNGITEIAIYIHNGVTIVNEFISLVNPLKPIPPFLERYTGITNKMVQNAPSFNQIAEEVYGLLKDCVFIAHNVNFDYSFIHHQLKECGFNLNAPKLCTVRLSRKIFSGHKSYSLGNICAALNIPIHNRHRAAGDAIATVKLFERLLHHDTHQYIAAALKRGSKEYVLPPHLPKEDFERISHKTGVYYFYGNDGKVIYIGKAKNLKTRVASHFSGNSTGKQKQDFLRNIYRISFTECATELMAFILESVEIKTHWPLYNRAQKQLDFNFGIYTYTDRNNFQRLAIERVRKHITPIQTYRTRLEAIQALQQLVIDNKLCPKMCFLVTGNQSCATLEEYTCKGACIKKESATAYNKRVKKAAETLVTAESYALFDKGLYADEKSCILVENGKFYGMGYIPIEKKNIDLVDLKTTITHHKHSFYIKGLLQSPTLTKHAEVVYFT
jgi:DNA polymerase III subunit epsilon